MRMIDKLSKGDIMNLIVAVDNKWGIGKNNDLLFSIKEDMAYFRATTLNKTVVMGGNTLRSFPGGKPLKNRTNIVITSSNPEDVVVVRNFDELFEKLKEVKEEIFVIGGASIYHQLLPYCQKAYVTKVFADGKAQVFFDNLDEMDNWVVETQSEVIEAGDYQIRFYVYKNNDVKTYKK